MTDLEAHVSAEGRDKLVKQVREKINELGVTYIYYQFISVTGGFYWGGWLEWENAVGRNAGAARALQTTSTPQREGT